jgi:DNA invertase Pin-like site-specific DNA recombinase
MTKYIAYCRKSRDEADKQILSIEAQITELKEFAKREKLEIIEFIEEAKTAKVPGREKFAELIKKIEKSHANAILAWHPDRLARNSMDGGKIVYLLDTGKLVDLKFPTFWFDNTPQGKFMLSIAFGQSKYYVDNLSENVKRGLRQKLRNGVWPAKAPYGYFNNSKTRGIDVDSEKSKAIKRAFEMFVEGSHTFTDIAKYLQRFDLHRKNGKPLHINEIRQILSNKFYIGIMFYNGEYHDGTHKCFISKDLFQKAQEEIQRRSKHFKKSYRFPFLGLARCSECGAAITAEQHIKFYKTTNRRVTYVYYRCTKKLGPCSQVPITSFEMEEQIRKVVSDVVLPQSWANQWLKFLERDELSEKESSETTIKNLKTEILEIDRKQNTLLDSYLDSVVDPETYKTKKNELFETKLKLQEKITKVAEIGSSWLEPMREFINCALQAQKIAHAKNNCEELAFFAKRVGSNFFLRNRQLSAEYKKGFAALRAGGGARSASFREADTSLLVAITERSANLF